MTNGNFRTKGLTQPFQFKLLVAVKLCCLSLTISLFIRHLFCIFVILKSSERSITMFYCKYNVCYPFVWFHYTEIYCYCTQLLEKWLAYEMANKLKLSKNFIKKIAGGGAYLKHCLQQNTFCVSQMAHFNRSPCYTVLSHLIAFLFYWPLITSPLLEDSGYPLDAMTTVTADLSGTQLTSCLLILPSQQAYDIHTVSKKYQVQEF